MLVVFRSVAFLLSDFLVKAVQRGETRVYLRLTDKDGNGLDDLKFRVPAAG